MIKQLEMTGKNKDEAINRALATLGLERDDVSVEILELGKTGFLGIGSVPAKVRVTYEVPDEEPVKPAPPVTPEPPKPVETPKPAKAPMAPETPKPAKAPKSPKTPEPPKAPKTPEPSKMPEPPKAAQRSETPPAPQGEDDVEARITAFLTGLLAQLQQRGEGPSPAEPHTDETEESRAAKGAF